MSMVRVFVGAAMLAAGGSPVFGRTSPGPASNLEMAPALEGVVEDRGGLPLATNHCVHAPVISGLGFFAVDLAGTTTDGSAHPQCNSFGSTQIWRDAWYLWTSVVNGPVTVDTCGDFSVDTKIAVYAPGSFCPPTSEYVISCNDDACGLQSSVTFVAQAGQTYRIRIGRYGQTEPSASGSGLLSISASGGVDICGAEGGPCQDAVLSQPAYTSALTFRCADDVTFESSGVITGLCWSGSYPANGVAPDDFVLTYWTDLGGAPGAPIAEFAQGGGLSVIRAISGGLDVANQPNFVYSASHAPVPVAGGQRYWVSVRNYGPGTWFWQTANTGNGALQDETPLITWADSVNIGRNLTMCVGFESSCAMDTNGDGQVNFADLNNVISVFNTGCP